MIIKRREELCVRVRLPIDKTDDELKELIMTVAKNRGFVNYNKLEWHIENHFDHLEIAEVRSVMGIFTWYGDDDEV